jgi:osmotically inducible protein OsmC
MALSAQLGNAGITPESLETTASLSLDKLEAGWAITKIHLDVTARIPGADKAAFDKAAENAKAGCPVSKLLKAEITMTARLVGGQATSA